MFRIISEAPDLEGLPDDDLLQLIIGCLAKAPADRPSVDAILTALTARVPGPASRAVPVAVPVTGSAAIAAPTGPGQYAQPPSRTAPPRPPGPPPGGPRARASRRRRTGALIGAGTAVAAVAAALPFLLTTHHPRAAAGYAPSAGPGVISRAAAHGTSSPHPASPGPGRPSTGRPSTGSPGPKPVPTSAVAPVDVTFHGSGDPSFFDVAFSPDGRMVAAAGGVTAGAFVWDIATGHLITLADPERSGVSEVAFSPDGKLLATADGNDSEYLWAMPSGTLIATLTRPNAGGAPYGMAFSPDGRLLAVGEGAFQTDLWDVTTRTLLYNLKDSDGISGVAFSPDDKLLASSGGPAFLWNVASGQRVASLYDDPGTKSGVNDVAFSPDGTMLAIRDDNGNVYVRVTSELAS